MCNLYSITKSQTAIIEFTRAMKDSTGNLPPMPGIFPDYIYRWPRLAVLRELIEVCSGGAALAIYLPRKLTFLSFFRFEGVAVRF